MNSMTGYGKATVERNGRKITIEMKSVNHRFLDIMFKLPRGFQFAEDTLRKILSNSIKRGHVEVFLTYEDNRTNKSVLALDNQLAKDYLRIAKELEAIGYSNDVSVQAAFKIPDLIKATEGEDDENELLDLIEEAGKLCIESMLKMRATEGQKLVDDLKQKIDDIEAELTHIKKRAPFVAEEYRIKLKTRISEAFEGIEVDETRLLNEVAFFVDKANIDEEITRLTGHIAHYRELLAKVEPMGKQLDFLTQEANREVNTIGSKSNDQTITAHVLTLKNTIEMVREQVQNLE